MLKESLEAIRSGLVDLITIAGVDVKTHPGRFSAGDLKRYGRKGKTILVSISKVPTVKSAGRALAAEVVVAVYVIVGRVKTSAGETRDGVAMDITDQLLEQVPFHRFGPALVPTEPKNLNAANLFSGEVENQGVALWAVSWKQLIKQN